MYYNLISSMNKTVAAPSYTARTTAFATATAITDTTILNALNTFDLGLISNGLASKMKALYPFVGGTATTQKYNFMDARDLDVAFRLQFFGGGTFSNNGYQPNGTNAYADTFLNASLSLTNNNYHLSHYSRTQKTTGNEIDIGAISSISLLALDQYYAGVARKAFVAGSYPNYAVLVTNTNTLGYMIGSRPSISSAKMYMNGVFLAENTSSNIEILPNGNLYLAANNNRNILSPIELSSKETAFASIGDSLTDGEASTFYTLVQAMQTSLSRQV